MFRIAAKSLNIAPLVMRAAVFSALLVAPVLAVPALGGDRGSQIEAPGMKKTGAGFVLMVSLQRR
jgi:hypothetical protein